jgi:hypothetical protein
MLVVVEIWTVYPVAFTAAVIVTLPLVGARPAFSTMEPPVGVAGVVTPFEYELSPFPPSL